MVGWIEVKGSHCILCPFLSAFLHALTDSVFVTPTVFVAEPHLFFSGVAFTPRVHTRRPQMPWQHPQTATSQKLAKATGWL